MERAEILLDGGTTPGGVAGGVSLELPSRLLVSTTAASAAPNPAATAAVRPRDTCLSRRLPKWSRISVIDSSLQLADTPRSETVSFIDKVTLLSVLDVSRPRNWSMAGPTRSFSATRPLSVRITATSLPAAGAVVVGT